MSRNALQHSMLPGFALRMMEFPLTAYVSLATAGVSTALTAGAVEGTPVETANALEVAGAAVGMSALVLAGIVGAARVFDHLDHQTYNVRQLNTHVLPEGRILPKAATAAGFVVASVASGAAASVLSSAEHPWGVIALTTTAITAAMAALGNVCNMAHMYLGSDGKP